MGISGFLEHKLLPSLETLISRNAKEVSSRKKIIKVFQHVELLKLNDFISETRSVCKAG